MTTASKDGLKSAKILLITTTAWVSTARLAMSLVASGCTVDVLCRRSHPIRKTEGVTTRGFTFSPMFARRSVVQAIEASQPDLIVSCDEASLSLLYRIHEQADAATRALIERSTGDPAYYDTVLARSKLIQLAKDEGVGIPATRHVASLEEIPACVAALGLPLVLKTDASSGGTGVRVVRCAADIPSIWRRLRGPTGLLRTINRVVRDRDWTHLLAYVRRETRVVSAQQFIPRSQDTEAGGREGNMGVVCWRGEVLASVCLEVVKTWQASGPSSVLRVIEQQEMVSAAQKIVRRLGFSGFCGFDFIFDPVTDRPLLLEMNPRPTQVAHLALGPGRDLTSALRCAMQGVRLEERAPVTHKELIALFPQEWQRDPNSELLRKAYHDVPFLQPDLVTAGCSTHSNRRR